MPELPEVRVSSLAINKEVNGLTINNVKVLKPKLIKEISSDDFINQLKGKTIKEVTNIGKFIIFHLSDDLIMISHLRMEGSYHSLDKGEKLLKHDHVIFEFDKFDLAYNDSRMFGIFHLRTKDNYQSTLPISKLAKEPQDIDVDELFEKLKTKRIAIKSSLLDQTLVLGLGNIYVNEVLFKAGVCPTTPSNKVSKKTLKEILKISSAIMDKSTSMGGTTIKSYVSFNDTSGGYQTLLKVHGKKGIGCVVCNTPLSKSKVGGRGTYFCSKCQK